ncbi:hypothetical protein PO124_33385 [Bacillus licheniformis]|nr:hypothetical protein [Bacillus licheniformis]
MGNTRDGTISFPNIRTYTLQGKSTMKSILFNGRRFWACRPVSTVDDAAVLLQVMLNGGGYGRQHLFSSSVISQFTEPSKQSHIWTRMAAQRQYRYGVDVRQARQQQSIWPYRLDGNGYYH